MDFRGKHHSSFHSFVCICLISVNGKKVITICSGSHIKLRCIVETDGGKGFMIIYSFIFRREREFKDVSDISTDKTTCKHGISL